MLLCMDFDGVVANGANECLIVSWLAFHENPVPVEPGLILEEIPIEIKRKFLYLRNYVRHDGHFIVPYMDIGDIKCQEEFEEVYVGIGRNLVEKFSRLFQDIREEIRSRYADEWFGFHVFYPKIKRIFDQGHDIHIVSGKDTESIRAILERESIVFDPEKVHGGLRSKATVLKTLYLSSKNERQDMLFIDDNLPNVIESRSLGIPTVWADWGFNTPEHLKLAKIHEIKATGLNEFLELARLKAETTSTLD